MAMIEFFAFNLNGIHIWSYVGGIDSSIDLLMHYPTNNFIIDFCANFHLYSNLFINQIVNIAIKKKEDL